MRLFIAAAAALALLATPSLAAPCRDAHGKFMKCPEKAKPKVQRCRGAHGRFVKCGTPGAKPA